jgi:hypothetical protein
VGRDTETVQKALYAIAQQQKIEVLSVDIRMVQEPLKDGMTGVPLLGPAHVIASR